MISNEKVIEQQTEGCTTGGIVLENELRQAESELAATIAYIQSKGVQLPDTLLDMSEWLTIKRYAERHGLSTQVVTNWIARGVIPTECVKNLPELNDLRLVRNQLYR